MLDILYVNFVLAFVSTLYTVSRYQRLLRGSEKKYFELLKEYNDYRKSILKEKCK